MTGEHHPRREDLIDFLDRAIPEEKQRVIAKHLKVCERCAAYLESVKETFEILSQDEVPKVEPAFFDYLSQRILRSVARKRSWRTIVFIPGVATAAVAILILLVFRFPSPPELDRIDLLMSEMPVSDLMETVSGEEDYEILLSETGEALESADEYLSDETTYDLIEILNSGEREQLVVEIEKLMKSQNSGAT